MGGIRRWSACAFTAVGQIADREPFQVEVAAGQLGWRRAIAYDMGAHEADVHPLLEELSFIEDGTHWGLVFHRSVFSVPCDDFARIAAAMGLDPRRL